MAREKTGGWLHCILAFLIPFLCVGIKQLILSRQCVAIGKSWGGLVKIYDICYDGARGAHLLDGT